MIKRRRFGLLCWRLATPEHVIKRRYPNLRPQDDNPWPWWRQYAVMKQLRTVLADWRLL